MPTRPEIQKKSPHDDLLDRILTKEKVDNEREKITLRLLDEQVGISKDDLTSIMDRLRIPKGSLTYRVFKLQQYLGMKAQDNARNCDGKYGMITHDRLQRFLKKSYPALLKSWQTRSNSASSRRSLMEHVNFGKDRMEKLAAKDSFVVKDKLINNGRFVFGYAPGYNPDLPTDVILHLHGGSGSAAKFRKDILKNNHNKKYVIGGFAQQAQANREKKGRNLVFLMPIASGNSWRGFMDNARNFNRSMDGLMKNLRAKNSDIQIAAISAHSAGGNGILQFLKNCPPGQVKYRVRRLLFLDSFYSLSGLRGASDKKIAATFARLVRNRSDIQHIFAAYQHGPPYRRSRALARALGSSKPMTHHVTRVSGRDWNDKHDRMKYVELYNFINREIVS